MREILDRFAAIAAALTVSMIAISVCHEFGYFTVVGRHFQTFLGPTDYLANAILWMPFAVISLIGWVDWRALRRVPEMPTWKEKRTWIFPGILLALGVTAVFIPGLFVMHVLNAIYLWALFFDKVLAPREDLILEALRKFFKYTVPIGIAMVGLGYIAATTDLNYPKDEYVVQIKGNDGQIDRSLLRSFGRGILVQDRKNGNTEFWQWDVISSITKKTIIPSRQPLSCDWFKVACDPRFDLPKT